MTELQTEPKKTRAPRRKPTAEIKRHSARTVVVKDSTEILHPELRKAVESTTIRNVSASTDITFLMRKSYNAMIQIAQKSREKDQITFTVPISEFEKMIGHNTSNSRDYLKQTLRNLSTLQVEFDYKGDTPARRSNWGIANLVAEVYIADDGQTLKFSFPPEMSKRVLDPEIYNRIDMRMQNHFTSYSALALYEIVSRYYTSPGRDTFRENWQAWSMLLSGAQKPHVQYRDFNKMLTRAIDQVNAHEARFKIVPHVSKRGRKIDKLWFVLDIPEQGELAIHGLPAMVSPDLTNKLSSLGLDVEQISTLVTENNEEYLLAQIDYTISRNTKKGLDPIANLPAFYMSAVRDNYADAPRQSKRQPLPAAEPRALPEAIPNATKTANTMLEAWRKMKLKEISDRWQTLGEDDKLMIADRFKERLNETPLVRDQFNKRGFTRIVETSIFEWMMDDIGAPDATELLRFALESGALKQVMG